MALSFAYFKLINVFKIFLASVIKVLFVEVCG